MGVAVLLKPRRFTRETSNKKSALIKMKQKEADNGGGGTGFSASPSSCKFLYRMPVAIVLLVIVFLWSSSTTIMSGSYVHVCISSRKLNNLYCLTAGAHHPNTDDNNNINNGVKFPLHVDDIKNNEAINDGHVVDNGSTSNSIIISTSTIMNNISSPVEEIMPAPVHGGNESVSVPPPNIIIEESAVHNQINKGMPAPVHGGNDSVPGPPPNIIIEESAVHNQSTSGIVSNATTTTTTISNISEFVYYKDNEELVYAAKEVEDQLQVHRSWRSKAGTPLGACDGRGIFVYDLPSKFNKDLMDDECKDMVPWMNFCQYFTNEAMGQPISKLGKGWYGTHQYSLEPIFHARVLKHPCRVYNENEAKLFYVPYYGGLDILRWHFKNATDHVKDMLSMELMKWLEMQKPWGRNSGKDHVFVLGKISWDFRRKIDSSWGTRFLELDQMQNPLKLLIERQPWQVNDIGIPHPTHFHPHSDNDITEWQSKIIQSKRKSLISFAGAARPGAPDNIRSMLIKQCTSRADDTKCRFLNCKSGGCDQPESVIELFMESEFCLQPPGDSPTRKSVFDSLISGCIPVLFDPFTAYYQYPWHLPADHRRYSVYIAKEEVRDMKVDVVERLMKVSLKEREDMRRFIVYELMPRLVYGEPNSELDKFEDAFSISINNLLDRVTKLDSS